MKLTLRDLFWLVLVVGMALGWWLEHSRTTRLRNENAELREDSVVLKKWRDKIHADTVWAAEFVAAFPEIFETANGKSAERND